MSRIIETLIVLKTGEKVLREFAKKIKEQELKERKFNQQQNRILMRLRK